MMSDSVCCNGAGCVVEEGGGEGGRRLEDGGAGRRGRDEGWMGRWRRRGAVGGEEGKER